MLRERNFRFALLSRSDLHHADLAWADLRATQMWKTLAKGKLKDARLRGAFLQEAQLQGAQLNSAQLQGADLSKAQLQGAELSYANLQGADLRGAELQGADLSTANLQGADLKGAQLQGAKLEAAQLQGADLTSAEIWLVNFPRDLANQSPAPFGLAALKMSPLTPEAQAQLKSDLNADIANAAVLAVVSPGWTRSCAMRPLTGRMEAAGRTSPATRRNRQPKSLPAFMLSWHVTIPRALSQTAWPHAPPRLKASRLARATLRPSPARF